MKKTAPPASPPTPAQSDPRLGECVRALRERKGWTLATLGAKTGLATSSLSRVENNQMSLTYENLLRLCKGLEVDISELFAAARSTAPEAVTTGRRTYTPPGGGRSWQADHYVYRYLCTELANKKMTPIVGTILAKTLVEAGGFLRHEGEETVYVIDGTLDFHTEFYEPLRIEKGGCVYFDSTMGHAFVSVGDTPVTMLSVCSSPEHALAKAASTRAQAPKKPEARRAQPRHRAPADRAPVAVAKQQTAARRRR